MKYKDDVLNYVLEMLGQNYVPFHILSEPIEDYDSLDMGLRANILHMEGYREMYRDYFSDIVEKRLYCLTDEFECSYVMFRIPETGELLVCGPVVYEQIMGQRLADILEKQEVPENLHEQMRDYYLGVSFVERQSYFMSTFTLLADHLFGKGEYRLVETDLGALDAWREYYEHYFRIPDKPFLSIQMIEERYEAENEFIAAVQTGNEAKAYEAFSRLGGQSMPSRMENEIRDMKDYGITLNTLMRKAAESAGVHPIHIDNLSNSNVQQLERATSVEQCLVLMRGFIGSYCQLIRNFTMDRFSPLVQKVLNCIYTDLTADLSLSSLARLLNVNASYLSTLFKKEMGSSLTDYVNRCRIRHAQHLLVETNLPIKIIAQQCGIPDVYYFGRLFKKISGTSPKAYRDEARDILIKQMAAPDVGDIKEV